MSAPESPAAFSNLVDLASERIGGKVLSATDEFFAPKENLLKPGPAIFDPDRYIDTGKWMDGWESRRKRAQGHDHCIVRLGAPGIVQGVDIDTSHFLGNHPPYASLDGAVLHDERESSIEHGRWTSVLARAPLAPGTHNLFPITDATTWTHVRLHIYPDGGVARLRIYGTVTRDWTAVKSGEMFDMASVLNGGVVLAASDMFFGSKENLIMPNVAESMRDGWETRRRRGPGYDWAIVKLGRPGKIRKLEIDTKHFKGNYPDQCSVDACNAPEDSIDGLNWTQFLWKSLLPKTKLQADHEHLFAPELADLDAVSHVMLNVYPDGGVSRLRVFATPS